MKTTFAGHTIKTETVISVEPGHQVILVGPADDEAAAILFALTGAPKLKQYAKIDGPDQTWLCAPHDHRADEHLMQLVDICADLRFMAPMMLQLRLRLDEHS